MKNWVAFIPVHLAVTKWPSSCKKIAISTPTTNTNHQMLNTASNTEQSDEADHSERAAPTADELVVGDSVTDPPATTSF